MIVNKTDKSFQTFDDFPAENWLVQFAEQGIDIGMTAEVLHRIMILLPMRKAI